MSDLYLFRTFPNYNSSMENWSPHIAIYGDMGNVNAQSLPRLQRCFHFSVSNFINIVKKMRERDNTFEIFYQNFRETQSGMYDMILHVGDFAYDMDTVSDFMKNLSIKSTSWNL